MKWAEIKRGPRPSWIPFGDGEDASVVAADLSPSWRAFLMQAPADDFARFGLISKVKPLDSAVRRGFIEPCGYVERGQWQYRLTDYGQAVAAALHAKAGL